MTTTTTTTYARGVATAGAFNGRYRLDLVCRLMGDRAGAVMRGTWLDCGCAAGAYTEMLLTYGATRAVGCDVEAPRIQAAQERTGGNPRLTFVVLPDESGTLPFPDAAFDGVLLNEVLEHARDQDRLLREIHRVLRPGGVLALLSPNRCFPFEGHGLHIGRWRLYQPAPLVHWLPRRLGQHMMLARNYWPWELRRLVTRAGFRIRGTSYALAVLEFFPWAPAPLIRLYRRLMPALARVPGLRALCSVSTVIVATR